MHKSGFFIILFLLFSISLKAQQIELLQSGRLSSLRGLSVVNDHTIWVSGSDGTIGRSLNGGKSWEWIIVPRYEKSDFRDIEAFNDQEAFIMATTSPAAMLRTVDGGKSWVVVFEDSSKAIFLDAMDFTDGRAAVIGDPEGTRIFIIESEDKGKTWKKIIPSGFDTTATGEAFFAASGSNIVRNNLKEWVLVSGGTRSSLFLGPNRFPLLMNQGKETTGANSIAINPANPNQAFIVGGDYSHDTLRYRNSLSIQFHPFVQNLPEEPPHGYRSCVEYLNDKQLICCGTSGVDLSSDGGIHWKLISGRGFNTCRKAKSGKAIFLVGQHGTIARMGF